MKLVLPICKSDFALAYSHAQWLESLKVKYSNTAVVCWDKSFNHNQVGHYVSLLKTIFANVEIFRYPAPPIIAWPQAPNWTWQHIAIHMAEQKEPWLFLEADAVLLRKDSLPRIEAEYLIRKKDWMGPVIKGPGHCNGVAVYPADAALRMPKAMEARELAWDYLSKEDLNSDVHDCSDIFCHLWIMDGENVKPVGTGQAPRDFTLDRAQRWIKPGSLLVHRAKCLSLTSLLRSGEYQP